MLLALADHGYLMTPDALEHLADDGQSMDLDPTVDFVLVADGFGDLSRVAKSSRSANREITERELAR